MTMEASAERCSNCGDPLDPDAGGVLCAACGMSAANSAPRTILDSDAAAGLKLAPGLLIGEKYVLVRRIGAGGMGEVWEGADRSLDRTVAVKFVLPELSGDEDLLRRFKQEAVAMAKLQHPNVVTIFDNGQHEGMPYIVMEHVHGSSLDRRMKDGLSEDEVFRIATQICEALIAAHKAGIIHRDLKPSNVLIDAEGRVKISDFGLAKLVSGVAGQLTSGTKGFVGTLYYASPEQRRGDMNIDLRTDIYSLGLLLSDLLAKKPANGKGSPSRRRSANFSSVVQKAMQPEREQRYASAGEMLRALRGVRPGGGRLLPWAAAAVLAAGGAAFASMQLWPKPKPAADLKAPNPPQPLTVPDPLAAMRQQMRHLEFSFNIGTALRHMVWRESYGKKAESLGQKLRESGRDREADLLDKEAARANTEAEFAPLDPEEPAELRALRDQFVADLRRNLRATRTEKNQLWLKYEDSLNVLANGFPESAVAERKVIALERAKVARCSEWAGLPSGRVIVFGNALNPVVSGVPADSLSQIQQVSVGFDHAIALRVDGTVVAWGDPDCATPPAGLKEVLCLAAGRTHNIALCADGSVAEWGCLTQGGKRVPVGSRIPDSVKNVSAVAAGDDISVLLLGNGSVQIIGPNGDGTVPPEFQPPSGLPVIGGIAAGSNFILAVTLDGRVWEWGPGKHSAVPKFIDAERIYAGKSGPNAARIAYTPMAGFHHWGGVQLTSQLEREALAIVDGAGATLYAGEHGLLNVLRQEDGFDPTPALDASATLQTDVGYGSAGAAIIPAEQLPVPTSKQSIETCLFVLRWLHVYKEDELKREIRTDGTNYALDLSGNPSLKRILPLMGLQLYSLDLSGSKVADIGPLHRMPLESLKIENAPVTSLAPLEGAKLKYLRASGTQVADLGPLAESAMEWLFIAGTRVSDLRPLRSLPIQILDASGTRITSLEGVESLPLRAAEFAGTHIEDLSPLRGKPLTGLNIEVTDIADISALEGMSLEALDLEHTGVSDISVLEHMPLSRLDLSTTKVADISVLKSLRLQGLGLAFLKLPDLAPILGMNLETLLLTGAEIGDLTGMESFPLRRLGLPKATDDALAKKLAHLKLTHLDAVETSLTTLDFIAEMPLVSVNLGLHEVEMVDLNALRGCPTLQEIAIYRPDYPAAEWPAAEFFRRYDAGEFRGLREQPPHPEPNYTTIWQITMTEKFNPSKPKEDLRSKKEPQWSK